MILLPQAWCEDSKNVFRFEIGPWEEGEKSGHADKQTNRQNGRSQSS